MNKEELQELINEEIEFELLSLQLNEGLLSNIKKAISYAKELDDIYQEKGIDAVKDEVVMKLDNFANKLASGNPAAKAFSKKLKKKIEPVKSAKLRQRDELGRFAKVIGDYNSNNKMQQKASWKNQPKQQPKQEIPKKK